MQETNEGSRGLISRVAPGAILLLGAPGVGKGTQAKLLSAQFHIPQVSTGDLLRQNRAEGTPLGLSAEELMRQGRLVPDQLINDMVAERLRQDDASAGYLLDGFPRTVPQAEWLDGRLSKLTPSQAVVAIEISVDESLLLSRITARRVCSVCGRTFNINAGSYSRELCSQDGGRLVQREDDTEEAFKTRLQVYARQTLPVIAHYRAGGLFRSVQGDASVEKVFSNILSALLELRSAKER